MLTIKFESEKDPSRPSRASDILCDLLCIGSGSIWHLVICFSATRNPRNPRFSPGFLWTTMLPDSLVTFSLAPRRISPTTPGAAQEKLPRVHSTLHRGGSSDVSTGRFQQQRRGGLLLLSDDGYWVKHGETWAPIIRFPKCHSLRAGLKAPEKHPAVNPIDLRIWGWPP